MNEQTMKDIINKNVRDLIRKENDPKIVEELIFSNLATLKSPYNSLVLREIFAKGMINLGKKMIESGFSIRGNDNPLYEFYKMDEDTCIYLVNKGADPNITLGKGHNKCNDYRIHKYVAHLIMHAGARDFEKLFNLISKKEKITFRYYRSDRFDNTLFEDGIRKNAYLKGDVRVDGDFYDCDHDSYTG